ncbi:unnamed protein product [Periconia digitata]|uniref:Uncharacterized protein n=1 Tax=Periconia digitata TaxID=1303443 RepID=A0A9W4XJ98_9PLEO|nr:unnamed protein product [Periconia digitata]
MDGWTETGALEKKNTLIIIPQHTCCSSLESFPHPIAVYCFCGVGVVGGLPSSGLFLDADVYICVSVHMYLCVCDYIRLAPLSAADFCYINCAFFSLQHV